MLSPPHVEDGVPSVANVVLEEANVVVHAVPGGDVAVVVIQEEGIRTKMVVYTPCIDG
jgi:hypothetical protein